MNAQRSKFWSKKFETNIVWTITGIYDCTKKTRKVGHFIQSKAFGDSDDPKTKWTLYLYPSGVDEKSQDFIGIFVKLEKSPNPQISTHFRVSIKNGDRWKPIDDFIGHSFTIGESFGSKKFISKEKIFRGIQRTSKELIIKCELNYEICCQPQRQRSRKDTKVFTFISDSLISMYDKCFEERPSDEVVNEEVLQILHNLVGEKVKGLSDELSVYIKIYRNQELEPIYEQILNLIKEKFSNTTNASNTGNDFK